MSWTPLKSFISCLAISHAKKSKLAKTKRNNNKKEGKNNSKESLFFVSRHFLSRVVILLNFEAHRRRISMAPNLLIKCDLLLFLYFLGLSFLTFFCKRISSNWIINVIFFLFYRGVHCSDTVGGAVCGPCPSGNVVLLHSNHVEFNSIFFCPP